MKCIIVDDEPLAREAIKILVTQYERLTLLGSFNSPSSASKFIEENEVNLIFLDIQMPGTNGIDFAKTIPQNTFVIFTTAYSQFATDSYEVDAIDYLIKPIKFERFAKAVDKANTYAKLFSTPYEDNNIQNVENDYIFVKADRKIFKIFFNEILFIEGLKDYVVIHTAAQKVITAMNIKTIYDKLSKQIFVRVSKSYIVNSSRINAVDNNTVFIEQNEIPIGPIFRDYFFDEFVTNKILSR
jgi:DNA-binding LytR/AlgR family response regulator